MNALAIVTAAELAKLRTYQGEEPALGAKLQIDQHPGKLLLDEPGAVFLVAKRKQRLWLVAMLHALGKRTKRGWEAHPNTTPIVDITSIAPLVGPLENRRLAERESEALYYVATYPPKRAPFEAQLPKWKLEDLARPTPQPVPPLPTPKVPKKMALLATLVAAQLEEVADELRENPKKFLARRNAFTETVQSIFEGSGDEARLLRDELAPWKTAGDVDSAAKRAIEDVCRGIVALAQDRERGVPKACASYRALLDAYVPWMRALLGRQGTTSIQNG